jgi:poly(hydroxyalkanoate) granule-associated protein
MELGMDTNVDVNKEDVAKVNDKKRTFTFYKAVRRIMLAGIGAIALKHDELEEFIDKLVERGEIARKDGESLMKEMRERRSDHLKNETGYVHKRFAEFLEHFSVPTKNDLGELSEKITSLEKKIDEYNKAKM